jgi:hypothetical protein
MLLIGMFDSPYVRRVAISMKRLGLPFEHGNWSVGADFETHPRIDASAAGMRQWMQACLCSQGNENGTYARTSLGPVEI